MKKILILLLMVLLIGCGSMAVKITSENNKIEMPSYSFKIPAKTGWLMKKGNPEGEEVFLSNALSGYYSHNIRIIYIPVPKEIEDWTAKEIADDYRKNEKNVMIREGVKKGLYKLKDVKMEEEILGKKKFYKMTYKTMSKSVNQIGELYLYFPNESGNEYFVIALYTMSINPNTIIAVKTEKDDFLYILKTLKLSL